MMYSVLDHRISPSPPGATVQSRWGNIPHSWVLGFFDRTLEEFLLQLGNLQLPRGGALTAFNLILTECNSCQCVPGAAILNLSLPPWLPLRHGDHVFFVAVDLRRSRAKASEQTREEAVRDCRSEEDQCDRLCRRHDDQRASGPG